MEKNLKKRFIYLIWGMVLTPFVSFSQVSDDLEIQDLIGVLSESEVLDQEVVNQDKDSSTAREKDLLLKNRIEQRKIDEKNDKKKIAKKPKDLNARPQPNIVEDDLVRFGYEIFDLAPTTYAPANDIPIPADYIIGSGDNIKIILFGSENDQFTLEVSREGEIYFPGIGPILVSGLAYSEMKELIKQRIKDQFIGVSSSVTLGELKSIQIFVVGESFQPGSYLVSGLTTITNALFTTGGITDTGSFRDIQIKRKGQVVGEFDLYDILLNGDTSKDIILQSGDVIFIPSFQKSVGIAGEIKKPAIYELKEGETLEDLLRFAGGFTSLAYLEATQIERVSKVDGIQISDIDLGQVELDSVELMNGDTVNINPILNRMKNVVLLSGYTLRPGFYEYKQDLSIMDIIKSYDELLPFSDRNYTLVIRENPQTGRLDFLSIDLDLVFSGDQQENVKLMPRDQIMVFTTQTKDLLTSANNSLTDDDIAEYKFEELIDQCLEIKITDPPMPLMNQQIQNNEMTQMNSSGQPQNPLQQGLMSQEPQFDKKETEKSQQNCIKDVLVQYTPDPNTGKRELMLLPIIQSIRDQANPNEPEKIIRITGNVNFPGEYPFSENMTVREALQASGGLKETSYLEEIELISFNNISGIDYKINRESIVASSQTLSKQISPGMTVHIKGAEKLSRTATIDGQVFFPGTYILSEGETIKDLIKRAGGLKENAFVNGAFFQREDIKKLEKEKISSAQDLASKEILYQQTQIGGAADLTALLELTEKLDDAEPTGRLVIRLGDIIDGNSNDVPLRDGDILTIPRDTQSVSVLGEVYVPTTHIYGNKISFNEYIQLSGGATKLGQIDDAFIIKANGSIMSRGQGSGFFRSQNDLIEPGDTIVVPAKIDDGGARTLRIANETSQLVYQLAVAAAAVSSLSN